MALTRGWWTGRVGRVVSWLLIAAVIVIAGACIFYLYALYLFTNPPTVTHAAALVDLDGDGDLDAALANGINESKSEGTLWINQGGIQAGQVGQFKASSQRLGSAEYRTLAAGDLDGDGDVDLLLSNTWYGFDMFVNQGGLQAGAPGQFNRVGRLEGGGMSGGPHANGLGDLDGDGDLDLLSGNCCGGLMMGDAGTPPAPIPAYNIIWTNRTAPAPEPSASTPWLVANQLPVQDLDGTQALALGDLDGDGDLDALLAKTAQTMGPGDAYALKTAFRVWWNTTALASANPAITFVDSGLNIPTRSVSALALGDLDGDGDLDALASTDSGGEVLINQGGAQNGAPGSVALSPIRLGSQRASAVFLGDLDRSGSLDALLVLNGQAQVWRNNGLAAFTLSQSNLRAKAYSAFALGDLDNDGDLDVFAAHAADNYQVWFNNGKGLFK